MLILADSFGVQRTSEELLEFLEVKNRQSYIGIVVTDPWMGASNSFHTSVRCIVPSSIVRSAPALYSVCNNNVSYHHDRFM